MNWLLDLVLPGAAAAPPEGRSLFDWVIRVILGLGIAFAVQWSRYSVTRMISDAQELRRREQEYRKEVTEALSMLRRGLSDHKDDMRKQLGLLSREITDYRRAVLRLPAETASDDTPTLPQRRTPTEDSASWEDVDVCVAAPATTRRRQPTGPAPRVPPDSE
jgi:hypothetical protein